MSMYSLTSEAFTLNFASLDSAGSHGNRSKTLGVAAVAKHGDTNEAGSSTLVAPLLRRSVKIRHYVKVVCGPKKIGHRAMTLRGLC